MNFDSKLMMIVLALPKLAYAQSTVGCCAGRSTRSDIVETAPIGCTMVGAPVGVNVRLRYCPIPVSMADMSRSRRHPAAVTLPLLRVETGGPAPAQAGQTTALELVCHPTNRTSSAGIPPSRPKPAAQSKPAESHPLALDISLTPTS